MKNCCVDYTGVGAELCSSRLRVGLTPLKNSLCIHAFVVVTLMTEEDSLLYNL